MKKNYFDVSMFPYLHRKRVHVMDYTKNGDYIVIQKKGAKLFALNADGKSLDIWSMQSGKILKQVNLDESVGLNFADHCN